jgi:hypothetical protein
MSISNDLDEVTTVIVCPICNEQGPKYWITRYMNLLEDLAKQLRRKYTFYALLVDIKLGF